MIESKIQEIESEAKERDLLPIWFVSVTGEIKKTEKSKKRSLQEFDKMVLKGYSKDLIKDEGTKKRYLKQYFKGKTNVFKRIKEFNKDLLIIKEVKIIASLGLGVKESFN